MSLPGFRPSPFEPEAWTSDLLDRQERRTGLVVKSTTRPIRTADLAFAIVAARQASCEVLLFITPDDPPPAQRDTLLTLAGQEELTVDWLSREALVARLRVPTKSQQTAQAVGYAMALIEAAPTPREAELRATGLWSRLPQGAREAAADWPLSEFLRIGELIEDLTFVMADIRNYSSIVTKARPRHLQEPMTAFYRNSREAIRAHGGTLVDIAGDGVLAVFDYPVLAHQRPSRALLCASDLIEVGRVTLPRIFRRMNADLPTGIRVGIASGEVLVVDSGLEEPEPKLVGEAINLSTRLQALAPTNGMMIDNVTYGLLEDTDAALLAKLGARNTRVRAEDAKGELVAVAAWLIEEGEARALAASHGH